MIRKKQQIKTLVFMLMLFVALISIFSIKTEANAAATLSLLRQNASSSPVSCNASNGYLPSSATSVNAGSSLYFNMQVDNSLKVKKADLYMKNPGVLNFYWKLTLTNGAVKTLSSSSITVKAVNVSSTNQYLNKTLEPPVSNILDRIH